MKDITIRFEEEKDYREVEQLLRKAFWNKFREGAVEHFVLHNLRDDEDFIRELDFVMEKDGRIIGQNVFVKACIKLDNGESLPVLTMGPISIDPEFQRKGYGKMLLDYSLKKAEDLGYGAVLIVGNIKFYEKSGFNYARDFNIRYYGFENKETPFFLARELKKDYLKKASGVYNTPESYSFDEQELLEFEKLFIGE